MFDEANEYVQINPLLARSTPSADTNTPPELAKIVFDVNVRDKKYIVIDMTTQLSNDQFGKVNQYLSVANGTPLSIGQNASAYRARNSKRLRKGIGIGRGRGGSYSHNAKTPFRTNVKNTKSVRFHKTRSQSRTKRVRFAKRQL
jgi:hypothetical protein